MSFSIVSKVTCRDCRGHASRGCQTCFGHGKVLLTDTGEAIPIGLDCYQDEAENLYFDNEVSLSTNCVIGTETEVFKVCLDQYAT